MGRSSAQQPSFFKVLSNRDFTKLLRVPPEFFGTHGLTPPGNVKLRDHSGRIWKVKVERLDSGGLFCFTSGWPSFARHSALQLGEFLIFSLVGESQFDVTIYGTSFCEREVPAPSAGVKIIELDARCVGGAAHCSYNKSDPLYFEMCLKKHHRSRITLRKKFLDEAGLRGKRMVMLEYAGRGSFTSVALDPQNNWSRVDLGRGWLKFRKMNRLDFGKTYSFRFNPTNNVIQVHDVDVDVDVVFSQAQTNASFVMLCVDDFDSQLPIPTKFVRKYRQQLARVTLETGDGKSWEVKLQDENGDLYMKGGWPEFVMDNEIAYLDFLTFRLTGDSAFRVSIYTTHCCLRQPANSSTSGGSQVKKRKRQEAPALALARDESSNPLYFETRLKLHHISRFNLPQRFTKAANLREKKYVKLVNAATGKCKWVIVDPRPYRVDLALGWQEFREVNGLGLGKTCSFRFIPANNAIHVSTMQIN